ncbi:hypothetical protein IIA15_02625 [candidate division TA06 bacterium]|nr:hypothetical protein [candidate division TA06 bacterium]
MRYPWAEIGIFLSAGSLVGLLTYPQYKEAKVMEREARVKVNLHALQVSMEKYAVYHHGDYPSTVQEMEPYFEKPGSYPINPYTQEPLREEEIQLFLYPRSGENRDNSMDGIHGRLTAAPGGIAVGLFMTPVDSLAPVKTPAPEDTLATIDSLVTEYGLIGFNQSGEPITIHDPAGRDYVFILRN